MFNESAETIQWAKNSLCTKRCWDNSTSRYKRMRVDLHLTSYANINSKWYRDLVLGDKTSLKEIKEDLQKQKDI